MITTAVFAHFAATTVHSWDVRSDSRIVGFLLAGLVIDCRRYIGVPAAKGWN